MCVCVCVCVCLFLSLGRPAPPRPLGRIGLPFVSGREILLEVLLATAVASLGALKLLLVVWFERHIQSEAEGGEQRPRLL